MISNTGRKNNCPQESGSLAQSAAVKQRSPEIRPLQAVSGLDVYRDRSKPTISQKIAPYPMRMIVLS
jgi:uncharacterized lipoprotein